MEDAFGVPWNGWLWISAQVFNSCACARPLSVALSGSKRGSGEGGGGIDESQHSTTSSLIDAAASAATATRASLATKHRRCFDFFGPMAVPPQIDGVAGAAC